MSRTRWGGVRSPPSSTPAAPEPTTWTTSSVSPPTCKTRVHALLNISRIGLLRQNELADPADIDPALAQAAIRRHPGFIVGIKARMSGSVVGESGLQPLRMAKQIQQANGNLPLMVHVGNTPPDLDEIVALLGRAIC